MHKNIRYTYSFFATGLLCLASTQALSEVIENWSNQNIGEYHLTVPGTYQVSGKVTGNINIDLGVQGDVVIKGINGTNPILQGIPRPGERRHVGHIKGEIKAASSVLIKNLTVAHHGHHILDLGGSGYKKINNVKYAGEERTINGESVFGVAPGNLSQNALIQNSNFNAGDDGHQISGANVRYENTKLTMYDNGSAIQLGWKKRFFGAGHYANNVEISGNIKTNLNGRANDGDNAGRSVIGGMINNNGRDLKLTNLKIDVPKYNHLVKIVVGSINSNINLDDVLIQGTTSSVFNSGGPGNLKAIALSALKNGSITNMVIDLGDAAANPNNHFIKGDVNVTFIRSNGNNTVYKNGRLQ